MNAAEVPSIAGRILPGSIASFVRRCHAVVAAEQAKPLPDNAIVGVLCDAVRFAREHVDREAASGRLRTYSPETEVAVPLADFPILETVREVVAASSDPHTRMEASVIADLLSRWLAVPAAEGGKT